MRSRLAVSFHGTAAPSPFGPVGVADPPPSPPSFPAVLAAAVRRFLLKRKRRGGSSGSSDVSDDERRQRRLRTTAFLADAYGTVHVVECSGGLDRAAAEARVLDAAGGELAPEEVVRLRVCAAQRWPRSVEAEQASSSAWYARRQRQGPGAPDRLAGIDA